MSSGHVKFSFDNQLEKFLLKVQKCFAESPKRFMSLISKSFPKCSSGHVEGIFDNQAKKFSLKSENFGSKSEKTIYLQSFSKKLQKVLLDTLNAVLIPLPKTFCSLSEFFFLK